MSERTREATVRAAEMWRRGCSAGVIAETVERPRSAVIAKLRRLGVKRAGPTPTVTLRPPPTKPQRPKPKPAPAGEPLWLELVALKSGQCRFPRGVNGETRFCGLPTTAPASSWCSAHKLICCPQRDSAQ